MSAPLETFGDKLRALAMALAVHVLCVLLVFVGLSFTHEARPVSVAGPVLEATLVTLTPPPKASIPRPRPQPVRPPPPKPEPAPVVPEIAPPVPPRAEDTIDQEAVDRMAIQRAEAEREQEERRKREQELLEEEERIAAAERERQQQLEDIRRQREEATKRRELEEQKLAQLADRERERERERAEQLASETESETEAQPQPGNEGVNDDLLGRYALAIQNAVTQNWLRPDNVQQVVCTVRIAQIPGGEVISASVVSPCNADDLTRRSLEAAVMRAQPLPYQGYESVFQRNINFNFCYPRELCRG